MFINSKKCFEIREGDQKLVIARDFIGNIPDWAARHWLVQAAIQDGSIATPDNTADKEQRMRLQKRGQRNMISARKKPRNKRVGEAKTNHKEVPAWMERNLTE
jgi:hypothetical protein